MRGRVRKIFLPAPEARFLVRDIPRQDSALFTIRDLARSLHARSAQVWVPCLGSARDRLTSFRFRLDIPFWRVYIAAQIVSDIPVSSLVGLVKTQPNRRFYEMPRCGNLRGDTAWVLRQRQRANDKNHNHAGRP